MFKYIYFATCYIIINNLVVKNVRNIKDVANFLSEIPSEKLSIFYGAGMSLNAGLPLANQLKWEILYKLCRGDKNKTKDYWAYFEPIPFEKFMEFVINCAEQELCILDIFNQGEPCLFHILIAHLIKHHRIKNILTTNFDMLLEQACSNLGVNIQRLYSEKHFSEKTITLPCYIKIHGSIEEPRTSRIFIKDISRNDNIQYRNRMLKYLFCDSDEKYVIIFGYSCSDAFDIIPYIEGIETPSKGIIFIEHSPDLHPSEAVVTKNKGCLKHFTGYNIKCNTDSLIEAWSAKEQCKTTKTTVTNPVWKAPCNEIENLTYSAKFIIAAILQHRTLWSESSKVFEELLSDYDSQIPIAKKIDIYNALSFNLYNQLVSRKIKKSEINKYYYIKKAEKLLIEADYISDKVLYRKVYSQYAKMLIFDCRFEEAKLMYDNIGNTLLNDNAEDRKFYEAIFNNSMGELYYSIYKKNKDSRSLTEAIQYYRLSFNYFAENGGYLIEKGIAYSNLAEVLIDKLDRDKHEVKVIELYIKEAENISKLIGDSAGKAECKRLRKKLKKKLDGCY